MTKKLQRYNVSITKIYKYSFHEEVLAESQEKAVDQCKADIGKLEVPSYLWEAFPEENVYEVKHNRVNIHDKEHFKKLLRFVGRTSLRSDARRSFKNAITTLNAIKRYSYGDYVLNVVPDFAAHSLSWYFVKYGPKHMDLIVERGMNGGIILHGYDPDKDTVDYLYYTQEQLDKLSWGTHT